MTDSGSSLRGGHLILKRRHFAVDFRHQAHVVHAIEIKPDRNLDQSILQVSDHHVDPIRIFVDPLAWILWVVVQTAVELHLAHVDLRVVLDRQLLAGERTFVRLTVWALVPDEKLALEHDGWRSAL
jgi:hypothetical protein